MAKYVCRQCKEIKDEANDMQHTLIKQEISGWQILFTPLCPKCFQEILSKPLDEMFPWKDFVKK